MGVYKVLAAEVYTTSYTMTLATQGTSYRFKVEAKNSVGFSLYSNEITVLAAQAPNQPVAPTTSIVGQSVQISWTSPNNRGATIISYIIKIGTSDNLTFIQDLVNCDGSNAAIRDSQKCLIPFTTLTAAPFNLQWGSSIVVKVIAINSIG